MQQITMTPADALAILEAPFSDLGAAQMADRVADSLMTQNQRALFDSMSKLPFRERLFHQGRFRRAILRMHVSSKFDAIMVSGFEGPPV